MKPEIEQLPSTLHCAVCQSEIDQRTVFASKGGPINKGDILVCSACGTINKVGDFDLVKLPRKEFDALDNQSKFTIMMLATTILRNNSKKNSRIIVPGK